MYEFTSTILYKISFCTLSAAIACIYVLSVYPDLFFTLTAEHVSSFIFGMIKSAWKIFTFYLHFICLVFCHLFLPSKMC